MKRKLITVTLSYPQRLQLQECKKLTVIGSKRNIEKLKSNKIRRRNLTASENCEMECIFF